MPRKAKRPCRFTGCPRLTESSSGYCHEHEKLASKNYDKARSFEHNKRYGYRWRKIRTRFFNANPLCELCELEGRYKLAEEIHHIKPLADGGTNDEKNLMSLCRSCHAKIHGTKKDIRLK